VRLVGLQLYLGSVLAVCLHFLFFLVLTWIAETISAFSPYCALSINIYYDFVNVIACELSSLQSWIIYGLKVAILFIADSNLVIKCSTISEWRNGWHERWHRRQECINLSPGWSSSTYPTWVVWSFTYLLLHRAFSVGLQKWRLIENQMLPYDLYFTIEYSCNLFWITGAFLTCVTIFHVSTYDYCVILSFIIVYYFGLSTFTAISTSGGCESLIGTNNQLFEIRQLQ